ncbi:TPA: hypothetical protein ACQZE1_005150 [Escherichia coli]|uniref:hypothetical protein n=1 Tax=Escherichia coli TaxID=562 RepID=UPI000BB7764A|nr:hypothetical protein [Escherichia coli]EAR4651137.1 hypothetical protein [Salmonella enterica]EHE7580711.1 hypothetical protein [Salmonella enterica subsp. enterica serovar Typhimurium]EEC9302252.1 hypothetical protein [Escherichia coli]EEW1677012.1 hypothetical protein [Escherichia coli]EEX2896887.1 hypothetical protein [Escherichia coli]
MSAFSFNTAYQPTGDQQKDAIAQIDIMQNRAVQANLAYQSSLDAEADHFKQFLRQIKRAGLDIRAIC